LYRLLVSNGKPWNGFEVLFAKDTASVSVLVLAVPAELCERISTVGLA
jgi:hypothetical protein